MTLMILLIIVSVKQFHSVEFLIPGFKKSVLQKFDLKAPKVSDSKTFKYQTRDTQPD